MSWYGNTLLVVVQDAFHGEETLPVEPSEVAARVRPLDAQSANYIEGLSKAGVEDLYEWAGLT